MSFRPGSRPLDTFNLPPVLLSRLAAQGFTAVDDLLELQPSDLAAETGLTPQEAVMVLDHVSSKRTKTDMGAEQQTALEILKKTQDSYGVFTMVRRLDEFFGGGIPMGKITEFCGAPGLGKTQLGIQLAVNVNIPTCLDGPAGHCIYIDTEGSFMAHRAAEIAEAMVETIAVPYKQLKAGLEQAECDAFERISVESILQNIYYFRVHNYIEQLALIYCLRERIKTELTQVKLIVVDSIAFHFRRQFDDYGMRTRMLSSMSQALIEIAKEFNIAVVIMNQITTKFGANNTAELVPALGETYAHSSTNRIMLYEKNGNRYAKILKSPNSKKEECCYAVTGKGMESVDEPAVEARLPSDEE